MQPNPRSAGAAPLPQPSRAPARAVEDSNPLRRGPREWFAALKRSGARFLADDCMGLAQEVAYSSLLAFFPATIALVGLLDLIGAYDTLESFLAPVAPQAVMDVIATLRTDTGGGGSLVAFAIGLAGAIWAASGALNSVVKAVNRAYAAQETRPFWLLRLISIGLVFATAVVTIGMLLLIVFGGMLGDAMAREANLSGPFASAWGILRWPLAFCIVLLLFALIYFVAPNVDQRSWKWITPGSLVGALAWLALSALFALYTSVSDSYTRTFGTLAGGIVLLLWLNYSAWAILFGAELNSDLDERVNRPVPDREARRATRRGNASPAR